MLNPEPNSMGSRFNPYFIIISVLTFLIPLLVMPFVVVNSFKTPKTLVLLIGVSFMVGIYGFQFFQGQRIFKSEALTPKIILFLIFLNLFSFFYTSNYYFTTIAATLNISCLLLFYFAAAYIVGKNAFRLIIIICFSGLLVSSFAWLQSFDKYLLFKFPPGSMIMGTIGNSNFLGAYLIFPLFATAGLIFLFKGKIRLIPVGLFIFIMGAFLFARARSSWFGLFLSFPFFLYLLKRIYRVSISDLIRSHLKQIVTYGVILLIIIISLWYLTPERFHVVLGYRKVFEKETLRLRFTKYYPPSIWLFKQSPLFGTGLWSYRSMVYKAQAEINRADPRFFKNYSNPKPRRAHNDYLEILNDGGLVAAAALSFFLILVMRHGWFVIKDEKVNEKDRIISATVFSSIIGIMLTAFLFFPFRVNSTMFMTVLMMGLMEGIYLRNHDLISSIKEPKSDSRFILIPILFLILIGLIWYTGLKPFKGETEYYKYKIAMAEGKPKVAERFILKAIDHDPQNSVYCLYASQLYMNVFKDFGKASDLIERAIIDFNGNITMWSAYFIKGLIKFRMGSFFEARAAFEKSLYYNPNFIPAKEKLEEVKKVIRKLNKVLIKIK